MKGIKKYRFSFFIISIILLCSVFLSQCINNGNEKIANTVASNYDEYAGSEKCSGCHKSIYENHLNTAHFKTSATTTANNILGSFKEGSNTFSYSTSSLIKMEQKGEEFFQVGYINGVEKKRQRFDMVIGSGTKGQSFASWFNNKLVQLPITYFTSLNQWCNSPGYPNKMAFNRPITSRCLECHTTYAEIIPEESKEPEAFNKNRLLLGVDCEKCHGPAAKHVDFHTKDTLEKKGKFIINTATLGRQQNLDLCILCHAGGLKKTTASFQFAAGKNISDYFFRDTTAKDVASIDVHGNQYGLMAASKCFKNSTTLTCISCHNSHESEKGKEAVFSQRCVSCHTSEKHEAKICKLTATAGKVIKEKCVSCHMPQQPSKAIAVLLQGKQILTSATMHTHLIKAYPQETQKILAFFKTK